MLKVIIKSLQLQSHTTKKGNVITKQQAGFDNGTDFIQPFYIPVEKPYPVGNYTLDSGSFSVSDYGNLEVKYFGLVLVPLK